MERTKVLPITKALSLLLVFILETAACSSLERSTQSGYAYRYDDRGLPNTTSSADDKKKWEREGARSELGPLASERAIALRQEVKRAERQIDGQQAKERYYHARPFLKSDSERLQFLRLQTDAERERLLAIRGVAGESVTHPPEIQELIDQNDIAYGMTRQAVRESWGAAETVKVAGNPIYGNEQWSYTEQVTSSEGYTTEHRVVTFEGGVVVGWETH